MATHDKIRSHSNAPFHLILEARQDDLLFSRFEWESSFKGWEWVGNPSAQLRNQIEEWLNCYLAKQPIPLGFPLNLEITTPFFKHVYQKLIEVPFGQTLSYRDLAFAAGRPKAARAIGQACGRNPYVLFVPCHRVLAAAGKIGGFGCGRGLELKQALLKFEG